MKRIVRYIILIVLTGLLSWGIAWANHKSVLEPCTGIDVVIVNADSSTFVTPEGIRKDLERMGYKPVGLPVSRINTDDIEAKLTKSDYLENVDCAINSNNHLLIRVTQIVPVMRVHDSNTDTPYYINKNGKRMLSSLIYKADVPVVEGSFSKRFPATRMIPLVEYIQQDTLLRNLVTMVSVRDSNNIYIVPAISGHVVNLGNLDNLKSKFDKLLAFYRTVLPVKGYEYYDTISVKWNYQVTATRRNKRVIQKIEVDSTDLEGDIDLESLQGSPSQAKPQAAATKPQATPKPQPAAAPKPQAAAAKPQATAPANKKK